MAGNPELIGGVGVTLAADYGPLLQQFSQAEAAARAAGQAIAAATGQGFGAGSGLVDQYGRALASSTASAQSATAASEQLASALATETQAAAASVPASEAAAAGFEQMGAAASHGVTQIQALSGGIRLMEGQAGIRAVERFLNTIPGVGAAFQAAFPIIGALAMAQILGKIFDEIDPLTNAEKKLAEQTKQTDAEFARLGKELVQVDAKIAALNFGRHAGLEITGSEDRTELAETEAAIKSADVAIKHFADSASGARATMALLAGVFGSGGAAFGSMTAARQMAAATKQQEEAENEKQNLQRRAQLERKQIEAADLQDKKDAAEEAKRATEQANTALKQSYSEDLADLKSQHQLTLTDELKFWQDRLAAVTSMGKRYAAVHREVAREVGNIQQQLARGEAEAFDRALVAHTEGMRKLEANMERMETEADAITAHMLEEAQRVREGVDKANASRTMNTEDHSDTMKRLQLQRQYAIEEAHDAADQIALQKQLNVLAADEAKAKIQRDQADVDSLNPLTQQVAYAQALLKLQEDQNAAVEQQFSNDTKRLAMEEKESLLGQLKSQASAANMASSIAGPLAKGIMDGGKGIGKDIRESLKNMGQEMLGTIFQHLIEEMATNTLAQIISTDANTLATQANTLWLSIKSFLGFASGGEPPVGVASMVGERGPEMFVPKVPGTIIPNAALRTSAVLRSISGAAASAAQHLTFNVTTNSPRQVVRECATYIKSQTPQFSPYSS